MGQTVCDVCGLYTGLLLSNKKENSAQIVYIGELQNCYAKWENQGET